MCSADNQGDKDTLLRPKRWRKPHTRARALESAHHGHTQPASQAGRQVLTHLDALEGRAGASANGDERPRALVLEREK